MSGGRFDIPPRTVGVTVVALIVATVVATAVPVPTADLFDHNPQSSSSTPPPSGTAERLPDTYVAIRYPTANGTMIERPIVEPGDFQSVGGWDAVEDDRWRVELRLDTNASGRVRSTLVARGFTDSNASCPVETTRNERGHCLVVVVDESAVSAFGLSDWQRHRVESGAFGPNALLYAYVDTESDARALREGLLEPRTTVGETGPTSTPGFGPTQGVVALVVLWLVGIAGIGRRRDTAS